MENKTKVVQKKKFRFLDIFYSMSPLLASIVCILIGLLIGIVTLVCVNPGASANGIYNFLFGGLKEPSKVLYLTTPILLTGLAVAFANKAGLFNIGCSGQFLAGALIALIAAIDWQQNWFVCILLALIAGFVYGAIPGIFKAYFNVNEVITAIMLNWIALFVMNVICVNDNNLFMVKEYKTNELAQVNPGAILPRIDNNPYLNIGIFIAIFIAILLYIVVKYTTFGYELQAVGFNRDASRYAGISTKKNIILSMAISGALAGLSGALYYLVGTVRYSPQTAMVPAQGFNGIPVALLANSNPIGCIFTAVLISYLQVCSDYMQPAFAKETVDLAISLIIYLSAFSLFFLQLFRKIGKPKMHKVQLEKGAK